jgi:5-(carboxyamino)imidazole ribonucleotide mutase
VPESQRPEPLVGVIMGSDSDWPVMSAAAAALAEFDVPYEVGVYSAHRTPRRMLD